MLRESTLPKTSILLAEENVFVRRWIAANSFVWRIGFVPDHNMDYVHLPWMVVNWINEMSPRTTNQLK